MTELQSLQFLMHRTTATLSVHKLMSLLKPIFRESGSNKHTLEKAVYGRLIKYVREVTSKSLLCHVISKYSYNHKYFMYTGVFTTTVIPV